MFAKETIDFFVVLASFLLLIATGVIAGMFPAKKAASIMPAETLSKII
jgi:ABC-type lipoprotein release transport system permease subunit